MPRIFMRLVLARRRARALALDREPARRLAARRPLRHPRKRGEDDEVHEADRRRAEDVRDAGSETEVSLPEPAAPRAPDLPAVRPRHYARELRLRVVHVEYLITEDLLEDRARLRVV